MAQLLFEKSITVHFGDTDPQGILYFARAFELAHETIEDFWAANSLGWAFWFQNSDFTVPLRHAEADFQKPARAGEICSAQLYLVRVGNTSVEFQVELYDSSGSLLTTVKTIHVFVDRRSLKKMNVPDRIREQLERN